MVKRKRTSPNEKTILHDILMDMPTVVVDMIVQYDEEYITCVEDGSAPYIGWNATETYEILGAFLRDIGILQCKECHCLISSLTWDSIQDGSQMCPRTFHKDSHQPARLYETPFDQMDDKELKKLWMRTFPDDPIEITHDSSMEESKQREWRSLQPMLIGSVRFYQPILVLQRLQKLKYRNKRIKRHRISQNLREWINGLQNRKRIWTLEIYHFIPPRLSASLYQSFPLPTFRFICKEDVNLTLEKNNVLYYGWTPFESKRILDMFPLISLHQYQKMNDEIILYCYLLNKEFQGDHQHAFESELQLLKLNHLPLPHIWSLCNTR